jgi:hypothetical protein
MFGNNQPSASGWYSGGAVVEASHPRDSSMNRGHGSLLQNTHNQKLAVYLGLSLAECSLTILNKLPSCILATFRQHAGQRSQAKIN